MEKHPIFLNVSRGGSVDEAALVRALDNGLIRAAGLDVLEAKNRIWKSVRSSVVKM